MEFDKNFANAGDFASAIGRGGELEFIYDNINYSVTHHNGKIIVGGYNEENWMEYDTPLQALSYPIGKKRLGDILHDMKVTFRSL